MQQALTGIRVLDLTRVLAGPYCTMLLADMGAEVVKIEQPLLGDDSRRFGPFVNGESAYYMNLNRNKKGVTLNLKGEGKALFLRLVEQADAVVENYRPGTMEKLGLGYDVLREANPRLVYCSISGFGHTGPYRDRPGYDIIAQAMGGLMSTTGWEGGEPTRSGTAMGDVLAGLSAAVAILAALRHAERTGEGQAVDIALVDSVISSLEIINQIYLAEGRVPARIGNRYESCYPYDSFRTEDGSVVIGAANDKLWQLTCQVMERPDLAAEPRFATNPQRVALHAEVKPQVEAWTQTQTSQQAVELLLAAGVPAAPINTIDKIVRDEHFAKARGMFVEIEHPKAGRTTVTGSQLKFSRTAAKRYAPAPLLGQDNAAIYGELLGLNEAALRALSQNGVL